MDYTWAVLYTAGEWAIRVVMLFYVPYRRDAAAARALLPAEVEKLLSVLDERERRILSLRFGLDRGEPRTPDEVGELVHLSRERVRQIEARALSRLRHPSADTGIRWLLAS